MLSQEERDQLVEFLSHHCMCDSLTRKEVGHFLEYTDLIEFKKGDVIADIGEFSEALYFIIEGNAALMGGKGTGAMEIGYMEHGELAGELSFFDRVPRQIRMVAKSPKVRLLKLSRSMYMRLRVENPFIAVNLLEYAIISLDHLLRRTSKDMTTLSTYIFSSGKK